MTREEGGQTSRHAAGILRVEQAHRVRENERLDITVISVCGTLICNPP